MAYGEIPVMALFDRNTDKEQARELKFDEFIKLLSHGYEIIEQTPKIILLRRKTLRTGTDEQIDVTIYVPETEKQSMAIY